jgi:predicted RNA-binding protein with PIN domain
MTNKILIDAWNVIWKIHFLSLLIPDKLEQARSTFNRMIKNYFYGKKVLYKIIYDGQPFVYQENYNKDPQVTFARNPEKADDVIIKFLTKQSSPRNWTVITSDRHLSQRVKNIGAQILTTESFILKMNKTIKTRHVSREKTDPQIKKEDISYWLDKFESNE